MKQIPEVQAFVDACRVYDEANTVHADRDLDIKIAKRNGDEAAIAEAVAAANEHLKVWGVAYRERNSTARAMVEALGIDQAALAAALR